MPIRTPFESYLLNILVDQRLNDGDYSESDDIRSLDPDSLRRELLTLKELYPYDSETPPLTYSRSYGNLAYNSPLVGDGFRSPREYTGDEFPSRSFPVPGDLYGHPVNMSAEYSSGSLSPFLKDHYVPAFTKRAAINIVSKLIDTYTEDDHLASERERILFERIETGSRDDWWTERYFGKGNDGPHMNVNEADYLEKNVPGGYDLSLPEISIDSSQSAKVIPDYATYFMNKQAHQSKTAADNLFRSIRFIKEPKRKYLTIMDVLNFTTFRIRGRSVGYRPIYKKFDPIWMAHHYEVGDYEVILQVNYDRDELKNLNPERDPFRVSCSCPFWRWQGPEHWARKFLYIYSNPVGTASVPVIKDPMKKHGICKHIYAIFKDIIATYRASQGYRENRGKGKPVTDVVTSLDTKKVSTPPVKPSPRSQNRGLQNNPINVDDPFSTLDNSRKRK